MLVIFNCQDKRGVHIFDQRVFWLLTIKATPKNNQLFSHTCPLLSSKKEPQNSKLQKSFGALMGTLDKGKRHIWKKAYWKKILLEKVILEKGILAISYTRNWAYCNIFIGLVNCGRAFGATTLNVEAQKWHFLMVLNFTIYKCKKVAFFNGPQFHFLRTVKQWHF